MHDTRARRLVFYGVLAFALLVLVTKAHTHVLPAGVAAQVGHNSEALLFAILVCWQIQYLRPILLRSTLRWPGGLGIAAAHFVAAYALLQTGWSSSVVTLNEPIVAAGLMLPFLLLDRPLRFAPAVSLAVLALVIVFFDTSLVLDQAESLVPFMLAPLALDVFDRTVLEPDQPDRPVRRVLWMGGLIALALALMAAAPWAREGLDGWFRLGIDYGHRAAEAYWGWLLVHGYFSFWLRQRGAHGPDRASMARAPVSASGSSIDGERS